MDDSQRVDSLCRLQLLDTPPEERFDRLTRIAKSYFNVPIALISLVDAKRQWFKSRQGLDAAETPREISFCGHAILGVDIFVVEDALNDSRFSDNPLVLGPPNVRFYAGAPLSTVDGARVGTLCIIDDKPRTLSESDRRFLRDLADCVEQEFARSGLLTVAGLLKTEEDSLRARLRTGANGEITIDGRHIVDTFGSVAERIFDYAVSKHADRGDRIALILRDIAARKLAEENLRQSEEKFRFMAEGVQFGIVISRMSDGLIFYANAAARRMVDMKPGGLLGRRTIEFFVRQDLRLQFVDDLRRLGELQGYELQLRDPDSQKAVWITMSCRAAVFAGEQVILSSFYDITAKKEADAERVELQAQLRESQKMEAIGQLTGGIAHDFNNHLTVIMGNLEMLRERVAGDPRAMRHIDVAMIGAARSAELTQSLLAFARRQPLSPKICEVGVCIAESVSLLDRTLGENIEVRLVREAEGWPVLVDAAQLSACIINLANNARDAMPDGGRLTISVRNIALDQAFAARHPGALAGDYVAVEVSDTGHGMTAETAKKAFEPFFTTKEIGQGTGLGLSMVHGFVKQSGGHVEIDSFVDQGTSVRIYLPRAAERRAAATDSGASAKAPGGSETVLVVEDNEGVRQTVATQLAGLGYRVLEAADGAAALAILARPEPGIDLLFTDVVMPGKIDGYALAREAVARQPGLKVLLTSGFPKRQAGASGERRVDLHLLSKPYRLTDLAQAIQAVLHPV